MSRAIWIAMLVPVLVVAVLSAGGVRSVMADTEHAEAAMQADHSHEDDHSHGGESGLMRLVAWLGAFHPAAVHFPIALLLAALPAELITVVGRSKKFATAGRYCLVLGALSAVVTAGLGWCMGGFRLIDGDWGIMTRHRWAGTGVALLAVWLLVLCPLSARPEARVARRLYLMSLVLTAALVAVTGFLGGAMVWGTDHLSW